MKTCLINQPLGIGDVFFTQKIGQYFVNQGFRVIWPIRPDFLWYKEYLISPGIEYVPSTQSYKTNIFVDLRNADRKFQGSILEAKYKYVGIDFLDWAEFFNFKRNKEKEARLFYDVLKIEENERYIFKNLYVGTPPGHRKVNIHIDSPLRVINNCMFEGFNVLDWCRVIENAEEIYMVDTVYNYIMEKLDLQAKRIDLYSRFIPSNFTHIRNLFKVNYNYIEDKQ